ncbi:MAG: segregation/condensation protein A, partial [Clostridia bacterium]
MPNIFEYHASDSVKLTLKDFEGPIQLLYQLIVVDGKYDIETFPLANITHQYLEYMLQLDTVDMDISSDFAEVACTLLEIKSRSVLPKVEVEGANATDEADPEELLRYRMMMYAMMKEQGQKLKKQEQLGK